VAGAATRAAAGGRRADNDEWWRGGVIYQIYPRSFADQNGDGVGDLAGITAKLDHVARLGVDAIWLSPFFKSPMKDFGYDIADYCDVDPIFGTLADFEQLVARAHGLGLKVIVDQVMSHTSDQHAWFAESRVSRDNPRADWYVWSDPKDDGTPPNNWLSVFGGSAWKWDTRRLQYYLHNFLASQPDLNFHCPAVTDALLDASKFWLELGVDGFRLDAVNFCTHDRRLRDNPPRGKPDGSDPSVTTVNPYAWQWHRYDKSQPENLGYLERLRALVDRYPNTTLVGEVADDDSLARVAEYTVRDRLHMAYCFELFGTDTGAPHLHRVFERFARIVGDGWPSWALGNHDVARVATRWGGADPDPRLPRLALALQLTMRGSPCIYQGEELGLPEASIGHADLQDPYGIEMWPEFKGRDGCRTPMPWLSAAPAGGFSTAARTWLPVPAEHRALAVDVQEAQPDSLLKFYRQLLQWRRGLAPLVKGGLELLPVDDQVLAYVRSHGAERVLCAFNFSGRPARWGLPAKLAAAMPDRASGIAGAQIKEGSVAFEPWGGLVARL
jgi:alpha-glucosidase